MAAARLGKGRLAIAGQPHRVMSGQRGRGAHLVEDPGCLSGKGIAAAERLRVKRHDELPGIRG